MSDTTRSQERAERLRRNWNRPDDVFFRNGACHILAQAFIDAYATAGFVPLLIHPGDDVDFGRHVFVVRAGLAFDATGYNPRRQLIAALVRHHRFLSPSCRHQLIELTPPIYSPEICRRFRLPQLAEYYRDPIPRARAYLACFPPPPAVVP